MTNPNEAAYPTVGIQNSQESGLVGGLTKREYFAAMAMQALVSNPNPGSEVPSYWASKNACVIADALIWALNK